MTTDNTQKPVNARVSPCKGCTKRYPCCHAHCEDYKAFRAAQDEYLDFKHKQNRDYAFTIANARRIRKLSRCAKKLR